MVKDGFLKVRQELLAECSCKFFLCWQLRHFMLYHPNLTLLRYYYSLYCDIHKEWEQEAKEAAKPQR